MQENENDTLHQEESSENINNIEPQKSEAPEDLSLIHEAAPSVDELRVLENESEDIVVESDEHDQEDIYASDSKEIADYSHMSVPALIEEAERLLETKEAKDIKEEMDAIRHAILHQLDDQKQEKLQNFLENGGVEIDFNFEQPERKKIQDLYNEFKQRRYKYYKALEEQLALNLEVKKSIVEAIKELPKKDAPVSEIHKELHELQDRWRKTGPVPRNESAELWNNYHFHLDNYYKFLQISNELRDLDFKRNLEAKTILCEEAESLEQNPGLNDSFRILQELHSRWKQIGPVDREHREILWERFSEASKKIHDRRHEYFEQLRKEKEILLDKKRDVISRIENFSIDQITTHSAWQKAMKQIQDFREEFRQIGRINLPENDELWHRFNEALKKFNQAKNAFYKTLKHEHHENLSKKRSLLSRAIALKESDDWKAASQELKQIQQEWKKIGYVPKVESDKIWAEFREACNHFFDRLTEHNKGRTQELSANFERKMEILNRMKNWQITENDPKKGSQELKTFISEWRAIGQVPFDKKDIEIQFNKLLDQHFGSMKMNQRESNLIRFENKITSINQDNSRELNREEDGLRKKLDEAKKELQQLENNILFFAHVDEKNPIVRDVRKKIENQKEEVALLVEKIKMIRKMGQQ
jgi:hypothetical protein